MPDVRLRFDETAPPVVLRLKDGSLEDLLAGQYVLRMWMQEVEGEDGVYTLHARVAGPGPTEGIVRAILDDRAYTETGEPPIPEADEETAEAQAGWREFFAGLLEAAQEADAAAAEADPEVVDEP